MGLLTPAWMSEDSIKAFESIDKLTDEYKLLRAALEAADSNVRRAAVLS